MAAMSEVLASLDGRVGRLRLNRSSALNALNLPMVETMTEALIGWRAAPAVDLVVIDHAGEKGFCAGGDIRALASADEEGVADFFRAEYRLNDLLNGYSKPVAAFMDGVVMGGGAGISMPASHRIATEKTVFAMPEGAIGLFPDVGSGWRLPRMAGRVGWWLGLTGARLGPADCLMIGLATHFVPRERLESVKAAIAEAPKQLDDILAEASANPGPAPLEQHLADISRLFVGASVEEIVSDLQADGSTWALGQAELLALRSPTTLKTTFRLLEEGLHAATFAQNMATEFAVASRIACGHDFREGVRAVLVDRDGTPRWRPARLSDVTDDLLAEIFAPLPSARAWTPLPSP